MLAGCCCNLRLEKWFDTKGFSLVQKRSVLLTETPQQPNLLFLAASPLKSPSPLYLLSLLLWVSAEGSTSSASSPPCSSPSSFELRLPCVRQLHSWKVWREQILSAPVMLRAAHPQPRCHGTWRDVWHFPASLSLFPALSWVLSFCLGCKIKPFLAFFPKPLLPQSYLEPWVWASTAVSNLLIPTKNLSWLCHDMLCAFLWWLFQCVRLSSSRCTLHVDRLSVL